MEVNKKFNHDQSSSSHPIILSMFECVWSPSVTSSSYRQIVEVAIVVMKSDSY
ncbi:hypothetical protein DFA_10322 [Cavenderia fasciculata]|uniref:Uncharacterized protein n=1 Tax=Cavenderia fasciculata TaxID=261658 RepID=F4Q9W4_CACFS|nr:uncharacterized protein DFA_10322 [Cavenderia fasciculata]EGG15483.1 hypothetical protein DFA_10322 [Cavenderia fasciculata]|eukprot:XP_004354225.1 hypothetical protein DFA_10322 [Cavenderia fasciculata]